MKLMLTFLTLSLLSLSQISLAQDKAQAELDARKKIEKEFKEFRNENLKLREKHQDELYQAQLKSLKENHERAKKFFRELSKIEDDIQFGNKSENKKVQDKLRKKRQAFKETMKKERKKVREMMQSKRDSFQEMMKKRRLEFKDKIKSLKKS